MCCDHVCDYAMESPRKSHDAFLENLTNEESSPAGFELDKIISLYFEKQIEVCKAPEEYQHWFLEVTNYLLYTKALLETHRYYYR